jgi:hypothetical protein
MADNKQPTAAEMQARIAALEAQLAEANKPKALKCKIGEKGGVSVSGLNARFPVTLYADQWKRLLAYGPQIEAFIEANKAQLSTKATPAAPAAVPAKQ